MLKYNIAGSKSKQILFTNWGSASGPAYIYSSLEQAKRIRNPMFVLRFIIIFTIKSMFGHKQKWNNDVNMKKMTATREWGNITSKHHKLKLAANNLTQNSITILLWIEAQRSFTHLFYNVVPGILNIVFQILIRLTKHMLLWASVTVFVGFLFFHRIVKPQLSDLREHFRMLLPHSWNYSCYC